MTNSNRIIKLMFLALTFTSLSYLHAETSSAQEIQSAELPSTEQVLAEQVNDTLEKILRDVQKQFSKIDVVLQELAGVVANNRIKVKDKAAMKKEISALRDLINSVSTEKFVTVDPNNLKILLNIGKALTEHLNKALADKFHELPLFNLDEHLQYRNRLDITFQELMDDVEQNAKAVETLEAHTKDAGLTWYNKAFRWVEEKNKSTDDWHIGRRTLMVGLAAATAFYYYHYLDPLKSEIWIPGYGMWNYRNLLGWPYISHSEAPINLTTCSKCTTTPSPAGEVKLLGNLDRWFEFSKLGKHPIGLALAGATAYLAYQELPDLSKKYYDTKSWLYAKLRGRTEAKVQMDNGEKEPRYTFKDMVGYEYLKNELMVYVKYIEDPERFDNRKLVPPTGCLIVGPTRTGKSFGAECLAGEIREMQKRNGSKDKVRFFSYGAEAIRAYGIGAVLEVARTKAPCIILIDEIDLLPLQREKGDQLLGEFLAKLSGYLSKESKDQVIVIGITNKPENMDHALRQPGRFEKMIYVGYPSAQERKAFITKKFTDLSINPNLFDIDKISRETEGKSLEAVASIITTALLKANIKGQVLSQALLEESFDETVRRITRIEKDLPADEKRLIAVHQAGHALAHMLIDSNKKLAKVTIRPVIPDVKEESQWDKYWKEAPKLIEYGKMFTYHVFDRLNIDTQAEKVSQAKQLLAGHAGEKVLFGSSGYSYHREDKQIAFEIIKSMVFEGIRNEDYSKAQYSKLLETTHAVVNQLEAEMIELFEKNRDKLIAIVTALEQKQTLTEREVKDLLNIPMPLSPAAQLAADQNSVQQAEQQLINGATADKAEVVAIKKTVEHKTPATAPDKALPAVEQPAIVDQTPAPTVVAQSAAAG